LRAAVDIALTSGLLSEADNSMQLGSPGGGARRAGGWSTATDAYARSRPHNGVLYVAVGTGGAELEYDAGALDDPLLEGRVRDEFRVSCS